MRCCGRECAWNFLQRRLSALCGRYSGFVARYPYPFIFMPVLLSCVCSVGWMYKKDQANAVYMFTPVNARSKLEQRSLLDAFPIRDGAYVPGRDVVLSTQCQVIVLAKDGGSVLRDNYIQATMRLNEFLMTNIVVQNGSRNYSYEDLCMNGFDGCATNPHMYLYSRMRSADSLVNLSYPTATYDDRRHYLASSLGGVVLDPVSRQIVSAKAWMLAYELKKNDPLSKLWEIEYEKRLSEGYEDPLITYTFFHSQTLDRELAKNGHLLEFRFILMMIILVVFALACTFTFIWRPRQANPKRLFPWRVDWMRSRPYVALAGVIGAAMGVASAIGILCAAGLPFIGLIKVMPFLIIAVRLDNTFLMIGALEITGRSLPPENRISHAMSEAAVSITVTVLTDILSFISGVFTDFPSVQIFSIYTTLAIFITFIYQLTFLLGVLVLSARAEHKRMHNVVPCLKVRPAENFGSSSLCVALFCLGDTDPDTPAPPPYMDKGPGTVDQNNGVNNVTASESSFLHSWIMNVYAPFLLKRNTKIGVLIALFVFWGTSAYGCFRVRTGLEPVKLLLSDSYAVQHYHNLELYFWDYGVQMQLAFMQPGDLSDEETRQKITTIVKEFSTSPHGIGTDGVEFWLSAYSEYSKREGRPLNSLTREQFYDNLDYFLSINEYRKYQVDLAPTRRILMESTNLTMITGSDQVPITAFRVLIGMRRFSDTSQQREAAAQFRALADSYPEFKLVAFNILWPFVDQYEDILPNVLQEIYLSVGFMIAIALLLIPHPACAVWVALAIGSIDLGVIGYMTLWGLNMDTISMVTIIMSIGFSVDFTAHIAYAYVANIDQEPDERIRNALGSLAWPVLQGGISTLIGVVVLAGLNSYMVVSFFKTVFLVITFGLLHALVFLPVLLSVSTTPWCFANRNSDGNTTRNRKWDLLKGLFTRFRAGSAEKNKRTTESTNNNCDHHETKDGRTVKTCLTQREWQSRPIGSVDQ